jgi:hypothetical protein
MKKIIQLGILILFITSVYNVNAQKRKVLNGEWVKTTKEERKAAVMPEMINEVAPSDFKNYEGKLLVSPSFKAIGMDKWLTKRLEENYGKPYRVVTLMESMETGESKLDEVEYQYHVTVNNMRGVNGNDAYMFMLVDRKNNKVFYKNNGTNSFKKYLRQLLEN